MRAVLTSGERVDVAKRERMNDAELRRARDLAFVRMRKQGFTVAEVARYHRVTERYVYMRLARVPESAKALALTV